jgi:DNA polymerase-3 subunit beta
MPDALGIVLPAQEIRTMLGRVKSAINTGDSRYYTDGVNLVLAGETATLVATDGHRLAVASCARAAGPDATAIVPRKAAAELETLLDGVDALTFAATENHLFFATPRRLLVARAVEGQFPNHEKVIPSGHDKRAVVSADALARAIERVALVTEALSTRSVRLRCAGGGITISATGTAVGEATELVRVDEYGGGDVEIALQSRYVLDVLAACAGAKVAVELASSEKPALFTRIGDGSGYRCVVMPVRI